MVNVLSGLAVAQKLHLLSVYVSTARLQVCFKQQYFLLSAARAANRSVGT